MIKRIIYLIILTFTLVHGQSLNELKIDIQTDQAGKFVFGNKIAGFWMGNALPGHSGGFSGWTNYNFRYLTDFYTDVPGEKWDAVTLYPDHLLRKNVHATEEFYFIDNFDISYLRFNSAYLNKNTAIICNLPNTVDSVFQKDGTLIIKYNVHHPYQPEFACIGMNSPFSFQFDPDDRKISLRSLDKNRMECVITLGYTPEEAISLNQDFFRRKEAYLLLKKIRIESLLRSNPFRSADFVHTKSYYWALISMDDLITYQGKPGIFAGYPWFNDYWGRDTFISLPGALLVTGRWDVARQILLHFGTLQIKDPESEFDGRIPNRVQLNDTIYNTADGTPWFFYALQRYIDYSGDTTIMNSLYTSLEYFINSHIRKHTDSLGFLIHGDAETWMDAVGPSGPWSPRGNRAIEIQALWLKNLEMGILWANRFKRFRQKKAWMQFYKKLKTNFYTFYWNKEKQFFYDHLNKNGIPDKKIRPNFGFTFLLNRELIWKSPFRSSLKYLIDSLTYPYGVSTLPQSDPDFHPYHQYPPYYVKDEAYHNGLIWVWLNGMVKSILASVGKWDLYHQLLENENRQLLTLDGIGTLSELMEPIPRKGHSYPKISGTISQAWSLAEYLRTFHEDLVGIQPELFHGDTLLIRLKKLPVFMLPFEKIIKLKHSHIRLLQMGNDEVQMVHISKIGPDSFHGNVFYQTDSQKYECTLSSDKLKDVMIYLSDSVEIPVDDSQCRRDKVYIPQYQFVTPDMNKKWPVIYKNIGFRILKPRMILKPFTGNYVIHLKEKKPGEKGHYQYPENPVFRKGIADLKQFRLGKDSTSIHFEIKMDKLTDPGWRPGSGFQLTMILIAINTKKARGRLFNKLPFNAKFHFESPETFTHFILVGNGIEVYDASLKKKAVYLPPESGGEFGQFHDGRIEFSLPLNLFGDDELLNWEIQVYAGLQDDHGGGGIGEFREVTTSPGWWTGGGRKTKIGNVYDWLYKSRENK